MLAVSSTGEDGTYGGGGEMRVLSSANGWDRARLNAISAEVEGCAARVGTGVRR